MAEWTIKKLLEWVSEYLEKKGVDSPRLSAELLLCNVLELERIQLYTHFDEPVRKPELDRLRGLVVRAGEHEPIAYLVGRTEFYSIEFAVNRDCLIPRPETELLVERGIDFLRGRSGGQEVLDLCTGSGCVVVAIAKNVAEAKATATDIDEAALKIAEKNIGRYGLGERVELLCGDLFEAVGQGRKFDLIVSNPPYVTMKDWEGLDCNVRDYEPKRALVGGIDGLDVYRRIIAEADGYLKDDGGLILEIGYNQGAAIRDLLEGSQVFDLVKVEKDWNGNDRIAIGSKK